MDVYETCPQFSSGRYLLRMTSTDDCGDLLRVYSDPKAAAIFNGDNCVNSFFITTEERMRETIEFWLREYQCRYYVRWSIVDRGTDQAIGTIELFHRTADDFYNHVGLLRLDLRSDYEKEDTILEILSILIPPAYGLFDCDAIATKVPQCAGNRIAALGKMGFQASPEPLYGHDGTAYGDYYILHRSN